MTTKLRELSAILATWIGLIAAIVGGYTTITGFLAQGEKQIDERKLQTFRMIEQFNSPRMLETRNKLLPLVRSDQFCQRGRRAAAGLGDNEVFSFVEFFDMVGFCIEAKLCDGELAYTFFGPYANPHWPAMRSIIDVVRADEKESSLNRPFGFGLEMLARRARVSSCHELQR